MSIGINLECCGSEISLKEAISLMKKNGFTKTFCFANTENAEEKILQTIESGIEFEFLHAQLAGINDMWKEDDTGDEMLQNLCDNVDICAKFKIPVLVVHMSAGRPAPEINDKGRMRYDRLMEYAREKGVKIAYENSRAVANLAYGLEKYEDAGFCWDVGHEVCFTPGMDYMPYFGSKLEAVHIHDNLGNLDEDLHMIPFDGVNDMEKVACELRKRNYQKSIMLELNKNKFGKYEISPEEFYRRASEAARKIESMITDVNSEDYRRRKND